ncbi:hypothetical protein ACNAN0_02695 [Agrilactobacillus fermenti]|uniref:hypothetical protein n=1 Tax=Agrilactobacillus fermenti TaxID=2586909 RepID=UPI001E39E73B|nr:hypothetical protein [Agrilactobacillus fermenti]MCD2256372.1 hypothetical protein [Agrilactobacillus fermenti]
MDLTRMQIAFTGKLRTMTHKQAIDLARALGAFPHNRPVKTTQVVISGIIEKPMDEALTTENMTYAENNALQVINEKDFLLWCQQKVQGYLNNI